MLLSKGNLQEQLQDLQHLEEITGTQKFFVIVFVFVCRCPFLKCFSRYT